MYDPIKTFQDLLQNYGRKQQQGTAGHKGSWFGLPDFGVTEIYASALSPGQTDLGNAVGDRTIVPYVANQVTDGSYTPLDSGGGGGGGGAGGDSRLQQLEKMGARNPGQESEYQSLLGGGDLGQSSAEALAEQQRARAEALAEQQRVRARGVYDEGMRRAGSGFDRAKGIYDEGMGALSNRRTQFTDLFNTGQSDISHRYEGERGNLQASAEGARQRAGNTLRAMGITGGSGAMNWEGRQRQENMGQLGDLQSQRHSNEQANQGEYDERGRWARGQESALGRSLSDAQEARTSAENQAGLIQSGDFNAIQQQMNNFYNQILQQQMAMQASGQGISGYQANPYGVNMGSFEGAITPQINMVGANAGAAGGANSVVSNPTYQDYLRQKQAGGSMYR